eukprot:COSAG02_NODE_1534_length_12054_cov_22.784442_7_plen_81_part_00
MSWACALQGVQKRVQVAEQIIHRLALEVYGSSAAALASCATTIYICTCAAVTVAVTVPSSPLKRVMYGTMLNDWSAWYCL